MKTTTVILASLVLISTAMADERIGLCCLCDGCFPPLTGRGDLTVDSDGKTCNDLLLEMADDTNSSTQGSTQCQILKSRHHRRCCDASFDPKPIVQSPTPAPEQGEEPVCHICKNKGFPSKPYTQIKVYPRFIPGTNTCESLYKKGLNGFIPDQICRPLVNFVEVHCGCANSQPVPGGVPTAEPTWSPTDPPTESPTEHPTWSLTDPPTESPTEHPTWSLTDPPTESPTAHPTWSLTDPPTESPTAHPTASLTDPPTESPTDPPTASLTDPPTESPTDPPTENPTENPTASPTDNPAPRATSMPTSSPTSYPTRPVPTTVPTDDPPKKALPRDFSKDDKKLYRDGKRGNLHRRKSNRYLRGQYIL